MAVTTYTQRSMIYDLSWYQLSRVLQRLVIKADILHQIVHFVECTKMDGKEFMKLDKKVRVLTKNDPVVIEQLRYLRTAPTKDIEFILSLSCKSHSSPESWSGPIETEGTSNDPAQIPPDAGSELPQSVNDTAISHEGATQHTPIIVVAPSPSDIEQGQPLVQNVESEPISALPELEQTPESNTTTQTTTEEDITDFERSISALPEPLLPLPSEQTSESNTTTQTTMEEDITEFENSISPLAELPVSSQHAPELNTTTVTHEQDITYDELDYSDEYSVDSVLESDRFWGDEATMTDDSLHDHFPGTRLDEWDKPIGIDSPSQDPHQDLHVPGEFIFELSPSMSSTLIPHTDEAPIVTTKSSPIMNAAHNLIDLDNTDTVPMTETGASQIVELLSAHPEVAPSLGPSLDASGTEKGEEQGSVQTQDINIPIPANESESATSTAQPASNALVVGDLIDTGQGPLHDETSDGPTIVHPPNIVPAPTPSDPEPLVASSSGVQDEVDDASPPGDASALLELGPLEAGTSNAAEVPVASNDPEESHALGVVPELRNEPEFLNAASFSCMDTFTENIQPSEPRFCLVSPISPILEKHLQGDIRLLYVDRPFNDCNDTILTSTPINPARGLAAPQQMAHPDELFHNFGAQLQPEYDSGFGLLAAEMVPIQNTDTSADTEEVEVPVVIPLVAETRNDENPSTEEDPRGDDDSETHEPSLSELDANTSNVVSPLAESQIERLAADEGPSAESLGDPAPIDEDAQQQPDSSVLFGTQYMADEDVDDASEDELGETLDVVVRGELPRLPPIDTSPWSEELSSFLSPVTNEPMSAVTPDTSYSPQSQHSPQSPTRTLFPGPEIFGHAKHFEKSRRGHRGEVLHKSVQTDLESQRRLRELQIVGSAPSSSSMSPVGLLSPLLSSRLPRAFFDLFMRDRSSNDETSLPHPRMRVEVGESAIHPADQVPVSTVSLTNPTTDLLI